MTSALPPTPEAAQAEMGLYRGGRGSWEGRSPVTSPGGHPGKCLARRHSLAGFERLNNKYHPIRTGDAAFNFLFTSPWRANERKRFSKRTVATTTIIASFKASPCPPLVISESVLLEFALPWPLVRRGRWPWCPKAPAPQVGWPCKGVVAPTPAM